MRILVVAHLSDFLGRQCNDRLAHDHISDRQCCLVLGHVTDRAIGCIFVQAAGNGMVRAMADKNSLNLVHHLIAITSEWFRRSGQHAVEHFCPDLAGIFLKLLDHASINHPDNRGIQRMVAEVITCLGVVVG